MLRALIAEERLAAALGENVKLVAERHAQESAQIAKTDVYL